MHGRHQGLPVLHDAFRTRDGIVQIVMELMQGLNICSFVASSHQYFEDQARIVFRDITGERLASGSRACMRCPNNVSPIFLVLTEADRLAPLVEAGTALRI